MLLLQIQFRSKFKLLLLNLSPLKKRKKSLMLLKRLSTLLRKTVMRRLMKSLKRPRHQLRFSQKPKKNHLPTTKKIRKTPKSKTMERIMPQKNKLMMSPLMPKVMMLKASLPKSSERQFLRPVFSLCER